MNVLTISENDDILKSVTREEADAIALNEAVGRSMVVHLRSEQEELERLIKYHTEAIVQYRKRKDVVTKAISEIEEEVNEEREKGRYK